MSVADPGFPRRLRGRGLGGWEIPEVGANTYYFAKFLPKTEWKWKKYHVPSAPIHPINAISNVAIFSYLNTSIVDDATEFII